MTIETIGLGCHDERERANARYRVTPIRLGAGLVLAAALPAVFAVVFLVSAALRRPVLGPALPQSQGEIAQRPTVVWGIALLVIAAFQGAGALVGVGSITSAAALGARFAFAMTAEIVLLGGTLLYLRRSAGADRLRGER
ncbi:MAG: hypothetical protein JO046_23850 [Solirubrobacterales bacterium]|nr:hypothetical protein [Solirubrobacterales bacterium]